MCDGGEWDAEKCGKKKKKRSFLQTQKRFAKQGSFGRGTQLSQDMYDYFINIIKVMNSNREDEEEMRVLASNIFHEIEGKELEYCCNQIISRAIENLLPFSSNNEFCDFIQKFSQNLRPIFSDPFGSHVLQQTLIVSYTKYKKLSSDKEKDDKVELKLFEYIMKISNFLFNNLDDFIWDMYSNSIARTVFNVLSGIPAKSEVKPSMLESNGDELTIPEEFSSLLKKFAKKVLSFPYFNDLCNQQINSGLLQNLLVALRNLEEKSEMIEKIILCYESNPLDLMDVDNSPMVRLLEVVLSTSSKLSLKRLYKLAMKEKLVELAKSKYGNFLVQKLIGNCSSKKLFGKLFEKLENEMEDIIAAGNSGVLLSVVKACRRLEICQGKCITMLTNTFHIKDSKDIVSLVATLTPSENFDPEKASAITIHGCLIVEEILHFRKPLNVVNSLMEMPKSHLLRLLCDTKGCHITDAFVKGSYVGEKNRDRFFKNLQGHYLELATSKHGSRSLDAIWSAMNVHQKASLAEELKVCQSDLCGNVYGKNFAWKIHLDNFRRNKEEWIQIQRTSETAEKYFADILLPRKRQKTS